jgi:hypothetical protein
MPIAGGDHVQFELMRPIATGSYVAVGLSKDDQMVCTSCLLAAPYRDIHIV